MINRCRHDPRWYPGMVVVAVAAMLALAACGDGSSSATTDGSAAAGGAWEAAELAPTPMPELTLTDTSGDPYDLRRKMRGKVTLFFTGYTSCPDVCPITLGTLDSALEEVSEAVREQVQVVFVSVDPARDDAGQVREFLDNFDSSYVGLTTDRPGDEAALDRALDKLAMRTPIVEEPDENGDYLVAHSSRVTVFSPDGVARLSYAYGTPAATFVGELPEVVDHDWRR